MANGRKRPTPKPETEVTEPEQDAPEPEAAPSRKSTIPGAAGRSEDESWL